MVFTTPRSALCLFQKSCRTKVRRSQPSKSRDPPLVLSFYATMMSGYRAVAKRRSAYAAMPVSSVSSVRTRFFVFNQAFSFVFSPCPLCSLCETCFLIFGTNENRGIAPSQKEGALTPRCLFLPCPLCELDFLFLMRHFPLCSLCALRDLRANP